MPACVTHYLHAKQVMEKIKGQNLDITNTDAFFWGAQGPDFLFCHRYFPWMRGKSISEYGHLVHNAKPSAVLGSMREFGRRNENALVKSYVMGFICHYALDSTAHPYVNMLAEELLADREYENHSTLHAEVESALDSIMLRRETGKLPTEIKLKKFFPKNLAVQLIIGKIYHNLFKEVFQDDISEEEIVRAANDGRFVFGMLTDKTTMKKRVFERIERGRPHYVSSHILPMTEDADIDYANSGKAPWLAGDISSERSFFELFENAAEKAAHIISVFETCDLAEITGEVPFG